MKKTFLVSKAYDGVGSWAFAVLKIGDRLLEALALLQRQVEDLTQMYPEGLIQLELSTQLAEWYTEIGIKLKQSSIYRVFGAGENRTPFTACTEDQILFRDDSEGLFSSFALSADASGVVFTASSEEAYDLSTARLSWGELAALQVKYEEDYHANHEVEQNQVVGATGS